MIVDIQLWLNVVKIARGTYGRQPTAATYGRQPTGGNPQTPWRNQRHVLNHEHFCRGTVYTAYSRSKLKLARRTRGKAVLTLIYSSTAANILSDKGVSS